MAKQNDPISQIDDEEDEEDEELSNEEEEEDDDDYDDYDEEPELLVTPESKMRSERAKMESIFHRISTERVPLRVHDVLIKGNDKTKESLIETEIQTLKTATSVQELLQAATIVNARLQKLDIFDSVNITLDSGPPELPGTTNVIVEVVEAKSPITGDIGIFTKPEVLYCLYLLNFICNIMM